MEQRRYLIDTNAVIDYFANKLPGKGMSFMNEVMDSLPNVSIISKIELLGFNTSAEHALFLNNFMNDAYVLDLTTEVADICISMRRTHKTKLPDSIIAATAIAHNMILITRNVSDFKNISKLEVLNPHIL